MVKQTGRRSRQRGAFSFKAPRAGLMKIIGGLEVAKIATADHARRKDRSSPINDSPVIADIRKVAAAIKHEGGLEPYELAVVIDLDDPDTKAKLPKLKTLIATLNNHCREIFKEYGLSTEYVHRAGNRIYIMGPELA